MTDAQKSLAALELALPFGVFSLVVEKVGPGALFSGPTPDAARAAAAKAIEAGEV